MQGLRTVYTAWVEKVARGLSAAPCAGFSESDRDHRETASPGAGESEGRVERL